MCSVAVVVRPVSGSRRLATTATPTPDVLRRLLALLRAHDLTSIAPALVARGAATVALLRGSSDTDLIAAAECRPDLDRLLGALESRPTPRAVAPARRADVPVTQPSARGSLAKALLWRRSPKIASPR